MKKPLKLLAILFAITLLVFNMPVAETKADESVITLRVCNCEDYIDEEVCSDFETFMAGKGKAVKVEYSTYGINENLYNDLKIAKGYLYDVICTSDYMIEKMAMEGMLKKITLSETGNYNNFVSPYIKEIFNEKITWNNGVDKLGDYATPYMWGTLGLVYNPEIVAEEDMKSWLSLWKPEYKNKSTIKDSVRDSFFIGIAKAYYEELTALDKTAVNYNEELSKIFGNVSDDAIGKVELALSSLKDNIFGFEVDSGKNDMVTGKISINFAWSGDAVYAIDEAESDGLYLNYSVPEEGSNVWFDGWCVPTHARQTEIAVEFIEYMADPEIAIRNMEYTGYTSGMAGDDVLTWVKDYYELSDTQTEDTPYSADLSYFFGKPVTVYSSEVGRHFSTQYPTQDVINRCVIMRAFSNDRNEKINQMWENVKGQIFPNWAIALAIVAVAIVAITIILIRNKEWVKKVLAKIPTKPKKSKYKIVSIEELNQ